MSTAPATTSRITELRRALTQADPGAFLVEPRVIRRIIRERYNFAKLASAIPHTESQIVPSADIRHLVHPDELGLTDFSSLPETCVLICEPDEDEMQHWPTQELLQQVWRRLFHARVDFVLITKLKSELHRSDVQERIAKIGQVDFDEAHFVLRSEQRLVAPESRIEAWREFVAVYLELRFFEPDLLSVWFPSISSNAQTDAVICCDFNAEELFEKTQLYGATRPDLTPHTVRDEARVASTRRDWSLGVGSVPSDRGYIRQLRRRERANERGNTVAAAVCAIKAAQHATSDEKRVAAQEKAKADVRYLVDRLRRALEFSEDQTEDWLVSLWELATNSIHGFWNSEKRLLYDLQKVCLDHERVIYSVDLVKWIVSRGKRPLRRPLTSLREVMMAKHLASSAKRLVSVRLSGVERERLTGLLQNAAHLAEEQMRHRMRPLLQQTLREVELLPESVPERVALDKLTEDSLDCIADRGYLTMGYLRDAISKNDLKLPDLRQMHELWRGDHLLRADDRLDVAMDGVYRRGEFYLRWLQITSSLFFGTHAGRFTTLFLVIPFGGALVIVEGVRHIAHMFQGKPAKPSASTADSGGEQKAGDSENSQVAGTSETVGNSAKSSSPSSGEKSSEEVVSTAIETPTLAGSESARKPESVVSATDKSTTKTAGSASTDASKKSESLAQTDGSKLSKNSAAGNGTVVSVPADTEEAFDQIVARQVETASWVLAIGFLLMALIHVPTFRKKFFHALASGWRLFRRNIIELPLKLLRLPWVLKIWRDRLFVKFRRYILTPVLFSAVVTRLLPWLLTGEAHSQWWFGTVAILASLALNSRLGRDAQELTAEWIGNAWHKLRARVVVAVFDFVIDSFRIMMNFVERFLYAVDEWLRFHSDESWLSIVSKAVLGVVWSFVSFLIRIYVNLLIEPTFHPVKHFPVVTVAHKMILPGLIMLEGKMVEFLSHYLGVPLARSITWFNIFFIPGIFGFIVWELKENWRLYQANRQKNLKPVAVGSHGETVARLLRPGFHSGTLPKLFRKMRRLEHQDASFKRFSARRVGKEQLEHIETAIRNFVNRELIRLLELCPVWAGTQLRCGHIRAASNSFSIDIECSSIGEAPMRLLFQEQSHWVAASVPEIGWLRFASADQQRSFQNALVGFYRKSGIDLVREQIEQNLVHQHQYDINSEGFAIWPNADFTNELTIDLDREGPLRPSPLAAANAAGIHSTDRSQVLFWESTTPWCSWNALWSGDTPNAQSNSLASEGNAVKASFTPPKSSPPACIRKPEIPVMRQIH